MVRHLPDHHHHVGDPVLDLAPDLSRHKIMLLSLQSPMLSPQWCPRHWWSAAGAGRWRRSRSPRPWCTWPTLFIFIVYCVFVFAKSKEGMFYWQIAKQAQMTTWRSVFCVTCQARGKQEFCRDPWLLKITISSCYKFSQYPRLTYHLAQPEHNHSLIRPQGLDAEEETYWEREDEGNIGDGSEKVGQEPECRRPHWKPDNTSVPFYLSMIPCLASSYSFSASSMSTKDE